jgi:hypothetical protein
MMRKILSTRGDHVARKLSIAGIIISPMNALRLAKPPVKLRGHRLGQHFYNLARRAQGIYREIVNQREAEEAAKRNGGNGSPPVPRMARVA